MTALPGRVVGTVTPRSAPPPRDEAEALRHAINDALISARNAERQIRRSMATDGVAATGHVLGVSRATSTRINAGHWTVVAALAKLKAALD